MHKGTAFARTEETMSSTSTGIEWTNATWNPMTGCTKISSGCDHCYAAVLAHTKTKANYLKRDPVKDTPENRENPFAPRFWEERLPQPLKWKTPMRIFVNSMSDVFHSHFSAEMIRRVFEVMVKAHWHDFQVLTKRPERALRLADKLPWAENIWIGTSIENMDVARRLESLRAIEQASVRFVSAEPLLGDVSALDFTGIHWVIGGGESGRGFRPPQPAWATSLRDRCREQAVAFLWKQWGGHTPKSGGRAIDGKLYDEYPRPHPAERAAAAA
jgi:protein gp37